MVLNSTHPSSNLSLSHTSEPDLRVVAEKGKIACRDYPHPRHHCAKFPFGKSPDESHCDQWVGRSKHCTAFDNDWWWNIKRKWRRELVERKKEAFKDFKHPGHMCVKYPFDQTPHDSHCELCYCYVCESAAPCKMWVGSSGHCHAFNNQKWRTERELKEQAKMDKEQSEPSSGVSITAALRVQSNVVLQGDQPQEAQISQTGLGGSVDGGESTDELSEQAQVYVENFPHYVTKHDLASLFEEVGVVKKAEVLYSNDTSKKFGLVTMGSILEAGKAVTMFNGYTLMGNVLTVRKINPKRTYPADDAYSIFVGNLSRKVNNQRIEALFRGYGFNPVSAQIILHRLTKQSRGFGFVSVLSAAERSNAIKTLDGYVLDGRQIKLSEALS